jgi:hypothetical protein
MHEAHRHAEAGASGLRRAMFKLFVTGCRWLAAQIFLDSGQNCL